MILMQIVVKDYRICLEINTNRSRFKIYVKIMITIK